MEPVTPLKPADATRLINRSARDPRLELSLTLHARDRMKERGLIMADVLHLLRTGFVYDEPSQAADGASFKYEVEGPTPNSFGRIVRCVVIPASGPRLKLVTVMWRDQR